MKNNNSYIKLIYIFITLLLINSCKKDFPDDIIDNWKPGLALPLAHISTTLDDVINHEDSNLVIDENGGIRFVYRNDSIFSALVSDYYEIPDQEMYNKSFALGDIKLDNFLCNSDITLTDIVQQIDTATASLIQSLDGVIAVFPAMQSSTPKSYELSQAENFQWVTFSSGIIYLKVTNYLQVTFDQITVTAESYLNELTTSLSPVVFYNLMPGQTQTVTIPIENTTLYCYFRAIVNDFQTQASIAPVLISLSDGLNITVSAENLYVTEGFAKIPEQVFVSETDSLSFESQEGERITFASFSNIDIDYNIESQIGVSIFGNIKLLSVTSNGETPEKLFVVPENSQIIDSWQLPNSEFDFSQVAYQPYNLLPVEYQVWINATNNFVEFHSTDSLKFNLTMNDMQFMLVQGYIGQKNIEIAIDTLDLDIEHISDFSGSVTLTNPQINLIVTNSVGIPSEINLQMINHSTDGEIYNLTVNPFILPFPAQPWEIVENYLIPVNNSNSNISSFMSNIPKQFFYSGLIYTNYNNPLPNPQMNNFVTNTGKMKLGIEFDLPLELTAKNLTFENKEGFSIDTSYLKGIESAELYLNVKNGFPFEIYLQFFLIDSISGNQLQEFHTDLLLAAPVDNQGRVTEPRSSLTVFTLDKEKIESLKKANRVDFTSVLNTTSNGEQMVKIYTDYKIDSKLSIKAYFDPDELN